MLACMTEIMSHKIQMIICKDNFLETHIAQLIDEYVHNVYILMALSL